MSLTELADQFDAVMMQQDSGNRLVDSVQHFFDNYLIATQTFTNNLAEAASKERARLEGMAKKDEMNSCWNAWNWFFKQILAVCRVNSAHIEDINVGVFKALGTYQKHMKITKPQTEKQIEGCMQMMRDEGAKLKLKMEETRIVFEALQKVKPSKKKKLAIATTKAELVAEDYRESLRIANEKMDLLRAVKIPAILAQVESDEQLRVTSLAEAMQAFASSNKKKTETYANLDREITEVSHSIRAVEDIRRYVTVCQSHRSATTTKNSVISTFVYGLQTPQELWSHLLIEKPIVEKPLTIETPRQKKAHLALVVQPHEPIPKVSNFFGQTIKEIMDLQKRSHPHLLNLSIPVIVSNIIKNLHRHGSINLETTFLSLPDPARTQWLRDQFESGNFSSETDPAVCLGLLKCWLRELKEPLIPFALVESCVRISRLEDGQESKSSNNEEVRKQVEHVIAQLPSENKEVLSAFIKLIVDCMSSETNKMNLLSLTSLFGPLILRLDKQFDSPSPSAPASPSSSPVSPSHRSVLSEGQSKNARNFVIALVKYFPASSYASGRDSSISNNPSSPSSLSTHPLDNLLLRIYPDIITTENAYGDCLHLLNDKYVFSVEHANIGLSATETEQLCNNIHKLFPMHAKFLAELTLTAPVLIPALFLKYEQMFSFYLDYQRDYGSCMQTLETTIKTNQGFAVLIAETEKVFSKSKMDLYSCLFMPLHRITQYVVWFREIKKHMPSNHPEHAHAVSVLAKLEEIATKVNENKHKTDAMTKMMEIQRSVRGLTIPLVSSKRTIVKDGSLSFRKDSNHLEPARVYLFSDCVLTASAVGAECISLVPLLTATVTPKETVVIDEVVSAEIPPVVVGAIQYLRKSMANRQVKTEGIFRIEASKDDLLGVRQEFAKTQKIAFDDVHVASNMLKVYLRELPVPLIPFDSYKSFLAVESGSRSTDEKIAMYRALLDKLPSKNKVTLQYLFNFLSDVANQSAVNLMTPQSLGVVFAPNLLRQEVDTAQNLLHDNQITVKIVVALIENCKAIFGGTSRETSFELSEGKSSFLFQCADEAERTVWLKALQNQIEQCVLASKTASEKLVEDRAAVRVAQEKAAEIAKIATAKRLAEEQAAEEKKQQERLELEKIEKENERIEKERLDKLEADRQRELMKKQEEVDLDKLSVDEDVAG